MRLIARRIQERLPENISLDDLVSTGVIGLISAIDNFDPAHNVKLKTYAEYKIRGRDPGQPARTGLGASAEAPSGETDRGGDCRRRTAAAAHARPRRRSRKQLGIPIDEYHEWLVEIRGLNIASLEYAGNEDGKDLLHYIPDEGECLPSTLLERSELERLLAESIDEIPDDRAHRAEPVLPGGADVAGDRAGREAARIADFATEIAGHSSPAQPYGRAMARLPRDGDRMSVLERGRQREG